MSDLDNLLVPESGQTSTEPAVQEPQQDVGQVEPADGATATEPDVQVTEPEETIAKSIYDNLRRDYTKKAMELADYKKGRKIPEVQQQVQPQVQQQVQVPQNLQGYQPKPSQYASIGDYIDGKVQEALEPIEAQQRELAIQTTVKALADKYDDFDEVSDSFLEVLEASPELFDVEGGLEIAYKSARADYLERYAEASAIAKQQEDAELVKQKQLMTGNTGIAKQQAPASTEEAEAQAIKDSILGGGGTKSIFGF